MKPTPEEMAESQRILDTLGQPGSPLLSGAAIEMHIKRAMGREDWSGPTEAARAWAESRAVEGDE